MIFSSYEDIFDRLNKSAFCNYAFLQFERHLEDLSKLSDPAVSTETPRHSESLLILPKVTVCLTLSLCLSTPPSSALIFKGHVAREKKSSAGCCLGFSFILTFCCCYLQYHIINFQPLLQHANSACNYNQLYVSNNNNCRMFTKQFKHFRSYQDALLCFYGHYCASNFIGNQLGLGLAYSIIFFI